MKKETSSGSMNAEKTSNLISGEIRKGEELQKSNQIINTPFVAKWIENIGWFAVCGKYRLTEPMETEEELTRYVMSKPWEMIITLINVISIESRVLINELETNKTNENGN